MKFLAVQITRFVDGHQPGWVACEFNDAQGVRHTFLEKVPIVSDQTLDATSEYPQPGMLPCRVLARSEDPLGPKKIRIDFHSLDLTTAEGTSEFLVLPTQLWDIERTERP
jgi:hypothetical protein